ncbi:MAG: bacterial Ig-like domain-containing protein, partial [Clostridia bacterium]|nr:bacterial Ig-like domain-containing protein [Clostridia bacterium]
MPNWQYPNLAGATRLNPWRPYRDLIVEAHIGEGITTLGPWAFFECTKLESISLPNTLTSIGDDAFSTCHALESIVIPEGVTTIGFMAFCYNYGLKSVTLPSTLTLTTTSFMSIFHDSNAIEEFTVSGEGGAYTADEYGVLYTSDMKTLVKYPSSAPYTTYVIPEGVETCANGISGSTYFTPFGGNRNLKKVVFPSTMVSTGNQLFNYANSLETVTVLSDTMTFGENIFHNAKKLPTLIVGNTGSTAEAFATANSIAFLSTPNAFHTLAITPPEKLEYAFGETLDTTGISVVKEYYNGAVESVDDYTLDKTVLNEYGKIAVTVTWGEYSSTFEVTVTGDLPAIPEGTITYNKELGAFEGFDYIPEGHESIAYEYGKVLPNGIEWLDTITAGEGVTLETDGGYYAFRFAAPNEYARVNDPVRIFVYEGGSNAGRVSLAHGGKTGNYFVEGKWTRTVEGSTVYYDSGAGGRFASSMTNAKFSEIGDLAWRYTFAQDEILAIRDISSFNFNGIGFAAGRPFNKAYAPYAKLYVAGGEEDCYVIPVAATANPVVDLKAFWPDEVPAGYVTAIELFYYTPESLEGLEVTQTTANYPVIRTSDMKTVTVDKVTSLAEGYEYSTEFITKRLWLDSISVAGAKTTYYVGDEFTAEGITVTANYSDGSTVDVTASAVFSELDTTETGTKTVTVTYEGKTTSFEVAVNAVELVSIGINSWPTKEINKTYYEGDPVDLTGLTIKATYNNGKTEIIALEKLEAVYAADTMTPGTKLTVSYGGKTISGFVLTVHNLDSITVTAPTKTEYLVGDTLVLDGMTVTANYENGTTRDVTALASVDTTVLETAGTVTVTVTYLDVNATFDVVVVNPVVLDSITVSGGKTQYFVGETYSNDGVKVTANYSDGTAVDVTAEAVIGTADTAEAGT